MKQGVLYLIPSSLGEQPLEEVLPEGTLKIIRSLECFIVEELKTARRFLRKAGYTRNFDEVSFHVFNEHSPLPSFEEYLGLADEGKDIGLLSEAGSPCIADPGSEIVKLAHENALIVKPLTGPSSILLSLMASGFNGQNFAFLGYLPVDKQSRSRRLKEIEKTAGDKKQTRIFNLAFRFPMHSQRGFFESERDMMIKFLVLLGGDVVFGAQPQRIGAVRRFILAIQHHRNRDMIGIFRYDVAQPLDIQKFILALF